MITKISLKRVASYKENAAILNTDKKLNLVYGLNGTGKTTLSNYLQDKESGTFSECSIEGLNDSKLLVYNQTFIKDNFYEEDSLQGIFTLSVVNKTAEEAIKNAIIERDKLTAQLEENKGKSSENTSSKAAVKKALEDKLWKIKTTFTGGDRLLDYCLDGLKGNKTNLFNHIYGIVLPESEPEKSIDDLKSEIKQIEGEDATEITLLPLFEIEGASEIEANKIFSESIIGNSNSTVSALIAQLDNSDWVKQGLGFLPDKIEEVAPCPFCQEKTITSELAKEIQSYFDETYNNKLESISALKDSYQAYIEELPSLETFNNNTFIQQEQNTFENLHSKLDNLLRENILSIAAKIKTPSNASIINSSQKCLDDLNDFIKEVNNKIEAHNKKIKEKDSVKADIRTEFWRIMRWKYADEIDSYNAEIKKLHAEAKTIGDDKSKLEGDIKQQNKIISESQAATVNIEEAIISINGRLNSLGLSGFEIKKHENNLYRVVRDSSNPEFESLSEGEKMIISFLYFLELCKGKESKDEVVTTKIIVIDDPISSLSHNYIFNVAQLIKNVFFENDKYLQIFVLTHSLYFFHELCRSKNKKLFRIIKNNDKSSEILEMTAGEIQNDYQSYWQVLKDHESNNALDTLLANSMRNMVRL